MDEEYKSEHTGPVIDAGITRVLPGGEIDQAINSKPNPNLLDNWYFGNPVNQRGQTTYASLDGWSGAYAVDRWKTVQGTYDTDAQTYTVKQGGGRLSQLIENPEQYAGRTVTFSALLESGTQSVYADIYAKGARAGGVSTGVAFESLVLIYTSIELPSDITNLDFRIGSNIASTTFKPVAAKIELGTEQTLAHQDEDGNWVLNEIPNYAEELAKCQTCLIPWGESNRVPSTLVTANIIDFIVPVPVTMRATPAIDTSLLAVCSLDGTAQSGFTFSNVTVETGFIRIRATKTSHGLSAACLYPTTKVFFDAGL